MGELLAEFTIFENPIPKGRPRFGKKRAYTPERTRAYETRVIDAFELACPLWEPIVDYIRFDATFYRQTGHHVDTDNMLKATTDALNGVAYRNDEQIAESHTKRIYKAGDNARTVVRMYLADEW
jgi:crossover junction endodeoxyribonuclease RusA